MGFNRTVWMMALLSENRIPCNRRQDIFANEEFDHEAFHASRCLLFLTLITTDRTEQVLSRKGGWVKAVALVSQGRTASEHCGLFTSVCYKCLFTSEY
ncbi:hypothetical protein AVEN_81273-1 [Araneus ventricosus]|uniref:Uncharacterized protein n=1 Tax=Araneus ventricosus TaxID=182803 RepID=A0A4Y2LW06_ARAVE|nr:hypothetical protein AVEN_81273-1 [Araneus ventricosus]